MKMLKYTLCFLITLSILVNAEVINRIVAIVNDQPVTMSDYLTEKEVLQTQATALGVSLSDKDALERIIENIVLKQRATTLGVVVSDTEIDAKVRDIMNANNIDDMEVFEQALDQQGLTLEIFREQKRLEIIMQNLVGRVVTVGEISDEEARSYYSQNPSRFAARKSVGISWIFVGVPENASFLDKGNKNTKIQDAHRAASRGDNFATVASRYSEDAVTKDSAGYLGEFDQPTGNRAQPIAIALGMVGNNSGVGSISPIQETPNGFFFVKIDKIDTGGKSGYDAVKNEVKNYLYYQKIQEEFAEWLKDEVSKSIVKKMI